MPHRFQSTLPTRLEVQCFMNYEGIMGKDVSPGHGTLFLNSNVGRALSNLQPRPRLGTWDLGLGTWPTPHLHDVRGMAMMRLNQELSFIDSCPQRVSTKSLGHPPRTSVTTCMNRQPCPTHTYSDVTVAPRPPQTDVTQRGHPSVWQRISTWRWHPLGAEFVCGLINTYWAFLSAMPRFTLLNFGKARLSWRQKWETKPRLGDKANPSVTTSKP